MEILLVVEYSIANLKDHIKRLKSLSDSQIAVGILSLNWQSSNYTNVIKDIKENIAVLLCNCIEPVISWTPGHREIAGNEIADSLSKEVAKKAKSLNEYFIVVIQMDINHATNQSTTIK